MATYKSHQHTIVTIAAQSADKVVITSTQASPVSNAHNIWFGIRREMVSCYSSGQSRLVSCIHILPLNEEKLTLATCDEAACPSSVFRSSVPQFDVELTPPGCRRISPASVSCCRLCQTSYNVRRV